MWLRCRKFLTITIPLVFFILPANAQIDSDGDGVADNVDNCLARPNALQRDTDNDGIGNQCDADLNDDCTVNFIDLGLFRTRFFSTDPHADFNGDGIVSAADLGILRLLFFAPPGPTGGQNLCSCAPPAQAPQADPNAEFGGQPVFLIGDLAGDGAAVPGLNNFSDQDEGVYLARLFARSAGTFDYRVGDQSAVVDYCSNGTVSLYASTDLPAMGCAGGAGSLVIPAPGCYEFRLETDGIVLPDSVAFTPADRLGRWDLQVDSAGGTYTAPNGVALTIPAGAVTTPTTLTIGDLACAQVDALFAATTLNSHDNRCLGAFIAEPADLAFNQPVDVSVPIDYRDPDEVILWLHSEPGRQDYRLVETGLTYRGDLETAQASMAHAGIFAAAGGTNVTASPLAAARSGPVLDPCCSDDGPPDPTCCCTTFNVQTTEGDALSSDCDCQLLGFELEIEFPDCPGSPVFFDSESHSSEDCPTDLQAGFTPSQITQWTCEETDISLSLGGTNADGSACAMSIPATWNVGDDTIASIAEVPPGTAAVVKGISGGVTTIDASSNVGSQFSFSEPLSVVDLSGQWEIFEAGSQTCDTNGVITEEFDAGSEVVQVNVPEGCDTIALDVGIAGLDGVSGTLEATDNPDAPFNLTLQATNSSNTLGCYTFFATGAHFSDFGDRMCSLGGDCEPLSCSETTTTTGTFQSARTVPGAGTGGSGWTFDASWSETVDDITVFLSTSCTGSSDVLFIKQ